MIAVPERCFHRSNYKPARRRATRRQVVAYPGIHPSGAEARNSFELPSHTIPLEGICATAPSQPPLSVIGRICSSHSVETTSRPPKWIKPQLTRLVEEALTGDDVAP